jgi:Xaa-Pro aminopeptidase
MRTDSVERQRRRRAAALLEEPRLDVLLVTNPHNVRYLTGFTGSSAMLLLYKDARGAFYTDPRYAVQSRQQVDCGVKIAKGPLARRALNDIRRASPRRIGFEQDHLTVGQLEALKKEAPARAELVAVSGLVECLRMVKDAGEMALIRASVDGNSRALERALKRLRPGMAEAEFAAEIDYQSRKLGAAPSWQRGIAPLCRTRIRGPQRSSRAWFSSTWALSGTAMPAI